MKISSRTIKNLEGEYQFDPDSPFYDEVHPSISRFAKLPLAERRIFLLYAEFESIRKVAAILRQPYHKTRCIINEIKNKLRC